MVRRQKLTDLWVIAVPQFEHIRPLTILRSNLWEHFVRVGIEASFIIESRIITFAKF